MRPGLGNIQWALLPTMFHLFVGTIFRFSRIFLIVRTQHVKRLQCGSLEFLAAVRPLVSSPSTCLMSYR